MKNKLILLLLFVCFINGVYAQVKVKRNFDIELVEKDSITSLKIERALNGFLTEAQNNSYTANYVDPEHQKSYEFFFSKLSRIGKDTKVFHQPLILKSYPVENGSFRLTIGFTGIKEQQPFIYQITELKAVPYQDHYRFYCPFEDNTQHFRRKIIANVTYYYSTTFNEIKAKEFAAFTKELAKLTKATVPELKYYSFNSLDELLKSYGFLYNVRQCNFLCYDLGFTDNEGKIYITGTNNENYVFGYIGDYLYYNLPNKDEIYWPYVQGLSAYYGGYGLSYDDMDTLKRQFRDEHKKRPDINFLDEFKKRRNSDVNRHFSYYVMSAFLFEEVLKDKGFDAALQLVYSGENGEHFFRNLEKIGGIKEKDFHKTIVRLIKD